MSSVRDPLNSPHLRAARASQGLPGWRRALPSAALLVALAAPLVLHLPVQSAVLGDAQLRSYLGQKLDAEIEISALTAAEAEALLVRIPASDAFAAAGIDMTTLVRSLRVSIEKRGDQTFVRVTSDQAVNDPFVLLLLELNAGGTRTVRQYALLIDPAPLERSQSVNVEPAIAEPQSQEATTAAAPPVTTALAAGSNVASPAPVNVNRFAATTTRRVRTGETLAAIGSEFKPDSVRLEQVLVALQRANPQAFAGNNINRMKSGSVLSVPSADSMRAIDANDARRIVIAQSSDFRRYSEALAERMNTPAANAGTDAAVPAAGNRSSSGSVGVQVREPGARPEPQDQLKLTAPGQPAARGAGKSSASANDSNSGRNDKKALDQVAADKALADANSRIAALEKNLGRMEQMLELRDKKLAEAQKAAELAAAAAKKPEATAVPSQAPATSAAPPMSEPLVAAPPATTAARTPAAPDASKDKPGVPAAPATSTPATSTPVTPTPSGDTRSAWTDVLQEPVVRVAGVALALLALLALLMRSRARRQGGKQARKRSKVNLVGSANAGAPAAADAAGTSAFPAAVSPTLAVVDSEPKHALKAQVQGVGKAGSEVDPIAEADVYIAYGRDEQAEEILRDALREQPRHHALHVKLLEIYAARRDRKGFADVAAELHAATGGKGGAWEQAAQMGQLLDPGNPLYGGLRQNTQANDPPVSAASAAQVTRSPVPPLQAMPAPATEQEKRQGPSSVEDFGLKLEGMLDEQRRESGRQSSTMHAPMQSPSPSSSLDFSLSGIGRGDSGGKRIEPTLDGESNTSALNTKFDLALACEEIGDHEGARELLSEVAAAPDPELSRRAQDMLRKLA